MSLVDAFWIVAGVIAVAVGTLMFHDYTGRWPWQDDDSHGGGT